MREKTERTVSPADLETIARRRDDSVYSGTFYTVHHKRCTLITFSTHYYKPESIHILTCKNTSSGDLVSMKLVSDRPVQSSVSLACHASRRVQRIFTSLFTKVSYTKGGCTDWQTDSTRVRRRLHQADASFKGYSNLLPAQKDRDEHRASERTRRDISGNSPFLRQRFCLQGKVDRVRVREKSACHSVPQREKTRQGHALLLGRAMLSPSLDTMLRLEHSNEARIPVCACRE